MRQFGSRYYLLMLIFNLWNNYFALYFKPAAVLSIFLLRIILFIKGTKYTADKKIQSNDKNIQ